MPRRRGRRRRPFKLKLKKQTLYSLSSLTMFFLTLLTLLSLLKAGKFPTLLHFYLDNLFGIGVIFLPFLFLSLGLLMLPLKLPIAGPHIFFGSFMLFLSLLTLFPLGLVGEQLFINLSYLIHPLGARALALILGISGFLIMTNSSIDELVLLLVSSLKPLAKLLSYPLRFFKASQKSSPGHLVQKSLIVNTTLTPTNKKKKEQAIKLSPTFPSTSLPQKEQSSPSSAPLFQDTQQPSTSLWEYPPLSLLSDSPLKPPDVGDFNKNAQAIESKLESFGIRAKVVEVNPGPAVTQYAIRIAEGIKVARIKNLEKDLALALAAPTGQIRIEAPIPGRDLVGIEVPNTSLAIVPLRHVLSSQEMATAKSKLAIGLGLDVHGQVVVASIEKMPHLLIAGATGSGKSVCINSIIATLLFRNSPEELRLILVDPKRVELSHYNGVPHLMTPVIVERENVISALKWAVNKMDERYKLLQEVGARNIDEYNELAGFVQMYKIVIVIDELAEIMLFNRAKVEDSIIRLAQMARAVGIHLILATQRPSIDVITGLIKANIPAKIAFNVTSQINSRVILDRVGAEKLLGRGDMLFIAPTKNIPERIQGTFVSTKEIKALVSFLKEQTKTNPQYEEEVTEKYKSNTSSIEGLDLPTEDVDPMLIKAIEVILQDRRASTSHLQRRLSLGYNKAARIMDQLEQLGVVGPQHGSKPRQILVNSIEEWKAQYENSRRSA